jgi:hypothetical protein
MLELVFSPQDRHRGLVALDAFVPPVNVKKFDAENGTEEASEEAHAEGRLGRPVIGWLVLGTLLALLVSAWL